MNPRSQDLCQDYAKYAVLKMAMLSDADVSCTLNYSALVHKYKQLSQYDWFTEQFVSIYNLSAG